MKPVRILAVLLLISGMLFLFVQYRQTVSNQSSAQPSPILGVNFTPSPTPNKTQAAVTAAPTVNATIKPTTAPTVAATSDINSDSSNIDRFIYPGATINSKSQTTASLTSSADPGAITSWYKDKLSSLGFNATSFVTTNSNNNVLNKLVVAKNSQEVRVDIKKSASESKTTITIESR
jgi:hypothetical protein